jgi:uncharacterized protein
MNALRFNVAGLLKDPAGAAREYEVDVPPAGYASLLEDAKPVAGLAGRVRMMRTPRSIFVRGHLSTSVEVECGRCLAAVVAPLAFDVESEFFPEIDIVTGHSLPLPADDLAFTIDPNHELDLSEVVRQHLLLELPMSTICDDACRGLCPRCGANLNQGSCTCVEVPADERLAPLLELFERAGTSTE